MATQSDQLPDRKNMDEPTIRWRNDVKPDYSNVDALFMKEKKMCHKPGSLEKIVEDLVKNFEVDSSYKLCAEDWQTVDDTESFTLSINGGQKFSVKDNIDKGNLNLFMYDSPLYDASKETNDSTWSLFKQVFKSGFPFEVIEVQTGPPVVTFTWRHWGRFEGAYRDTPPTGELLEIYGTCVVRVTDQLKIQSVEIYYDPNPMLATLMDFKTPGGCPCGKGSKKGSTKTCIMQ